MKSLLLGSLYSSGIIFSPGKVFSLDPCTPVASFPHLSESSPWILVLQWYHFLTCQSLLLGFLYSSGINSSPAKVFFLDPRTPIASSPHQSNLDNWNFQTSNIRSYYLSAIVIDNGSGFCKAGMAGDATPSVECPAVLGRPRYIPVVAGLNYRSAYVGWAAEGRRGALTLSYPVRGGVIRHWDDLELLWEHTFSHLLEVDPSKHPVIVTEAPKNPLRHREKIIELLFEYFKTPGAFVAVQAVMALYAGGQTTGAVLDSGEGVTHVVPIYEGYAVHHAILRAEYSGRTVTDYLSELLTERGYYFTTTAEREILQDIKERLCFVSEDFAGDMRDCAKTTSEFDHNYVLPDGQVLTLGSERFRCPEILLRPDFVNLEEPGFHAAVYDSVMKCDVDLRKDLLSNVFLSGGNTMFSGLPERLKAELSALCPCPVRLRAPKERRYAVWLGASILGALSTFAEICITEKEYQENGPRIVHRKCF